jgi:hypothetical protein
MRTAWAFGSTNPNWKLQLNFTDITKNAKKCGNSRNDLKMSGTHLPSKFQPSGLFLADGSAGGHEENDRRYGQQHKHSNHHPSPLLKISFPMLEEAKKIQYVSHKLAIPFVNVKAKLGDQRISDSKLRQAKPCNRKLADADQTKSELGDVYDPHPKLSDRDDTSGRDGHPVRPVLERNMKEGQSEQGCLGFVLKPPPVPFLPGRIRRPTIGT